MQLFAYGTLMPADPEEAARDGWRADAVRGRLYDFGPYPALIDLDHPDAGWVDGFVRTVSLHELEEKLDPWEEVEQGLYRREETITRSGCQAWVYVYQGVSLRRTRFRVGVGSSAVDRLEVQASLSWTERLLSNSPTQNRWTSPIWCGSCGAR